MIALLVMLVLCTVYLWLIAPTLRKRPLGRLSGVDYAHRGLWNDALPENSLPAFLNAAEHGFGIELDVHLTRDHRLAILHDDELNRMCPDAPEGLRVADCTLAELKQYHLAGTDNRIPEFQEVLQALDGRCPLIVELKTGQDNDALCRLSYDALMQHANGAPWCIESFDPRIAAFFRRRHPEVIRGQLSYAPAWRETKWKELLRSLMFRTLICNVLSRPDFVAWDEKSRSIGILLVRKLFRPHLAAWTVRSAQRMDALRQEYDVQIFEGFIPKC